MPKSEPIVRGKNGVFSIFQKMCMWCRNQRKTIKIMNGCQNLIEIFFLSALPISSNLCSVSRVSAGFVIIRVSGTGRLKQVNEQQSSHVSHFKVSTRIIYLHMKMFYGTYKKNALNCDSTGLVFTSAKRRYKAHKKNREGHSTAPIMATSCLNFYGCGWNYMRSGRRRFYVVHRRREHVIYRYASQIYNVATMFGWSRAYMICAQARNM